MKACKLVVGDRYLYTGGAVNTEVLHVGIDKHGYGFRAIYDECIFYLSALEIREFIEKI